MGRRLASGGRYRPPFSILPCGFRTTPAPHGTPTDVDDGRIPTGAAAAVAAASKSRCGVTAQRSRGVVLQSLAHG